MATQNLAQIAEPSKSATVIAIQKARSVRAKRGQSVFLTPEETLAVLKAARSRSSRDWAMILLAYRHGMRASEVCGLRRDDIDLKAEFIIIRRLKGSLRHTSLSAGTLDSHCSMN